MSVTSALDGLCWIGGERRHGSSDDRVDLVDPVTGGPAGSYLAATPADVDAAVRAARRALPDWSTATPGARSDALRRLAAILTRDRETLASVESARTGKPIRLAREFDVPGTIDNVAFFAGAARVLDGLACGEYSPDHTSAVRREAVGVVGSIAPWNYPLQMAAWKILPAIAAGNTVVLKPSSLTPDTTVMLAQACRDAGVPDGVVNVVSGRGAEAGSHLVAHPDVDMVSFTGSVAVGRRVLSAASATVKRVHPELGGKAPFVVFDDADVDAAVHGAVAASLINAGQDCTAATRAIVHVDVLDRFVAGVADLMAGVVVGDPSRPETDLGPLISHAHRDRVAGFVDRARAGGAVVVTGGAAPAGDLADGAYYLPTLVTGVHPSAEIVRREVFGPVLVVLPFTGDDEAFALANDTIYGLAASTWTTDVFRAQRAARTIRAGCVWINDHIPIVSEMPHGGTGQSGFGKDMSLYSLQDYTVVKHVMSDLTAVERKPWHRTVFTTAG